MQGILVILKFLPCNSHQVWWEFFLFMQIYAYYYYHTNFCNLFSRVYVKNVWESCKINVLVCAVLFAGSCMFIFNGFTSSGKIGDLLLTNWLGNQLWGVGDNLRLNIKNSNNRLKTVSCFIGFSYLCNRNTIIYKVYYEINIICDMYVIVV